LPDIVLLDVLMPEMDGYEVLHHLKNKEETAHIPVIFLTAKSDNKSELDGLSLGAIDYISKPFSPFLLLKRVEIQLLQKSQQQELADSNDNLQKSVEAKTKTVTELQSTVLKTMAELVEFRDDTTGRHTNRIQRYLSVMLDAMLKKGVYEDEIASWDIALVLQSAQLHDIGKIANPAYFTENQIPGLNPHDGLPYEKSARIIIDHVQEGVKIAKKSNLPKQLIDFIVTHHGTGMPKYFYILWKNANPDKEVNEADFRYPGPNPYSKETAIMMMADAVEAATRSLPQYSEESIRELVEKIIDGQLEEGFFKEAPITFRDIQLVKEVFVDKLKTIYHSRIAYPELKKEEASPIETNLKIT